VSHNIYPNTYILNSLTQRIINNITPLYFRDVDSVSNALYISWMHPLNSEKEDDCCLIIYIPMVLIRRGSFSLSNLWA
jgi:hypothetical protein